MANRDEVTGFRPYGPALRLRPYVASGVIYPGDGVKQEAGGRVAAATAGAAMCGVAAEYASGAGVTILVYDHPDQEFVGQVAADEVNEQTDLGLNCSIIAGTPNTTYRRSGMEIDGSTLATTATLECKILRLEPSVDNALGANAKVIFQINNHQRGSHTGTAGV
jgi:hypothetical protein